MRKGSPIAGGGLLAILAALAFGATVPIIQRAGRGVGPLTTAALLYAGACFAALVWRGLARPSGAPVRAANAGRLVLVALFGAALAPTLLAWGLQRVGGATGALLLNLEAAFTVALARVIYREPIGRRVGAALFAMLAAGALLAFDSARGVAWSSLGALAVAGATLAWALDNTLTRPLAEHEPMSVVGVKAALGAALTAGLAVVAREPIASGGRALALLACGATGYGLSLALYLRAQRRIGAARTGSIFALAPFVGAAAAWALGARDASGLTLASAALFGVGVALHLTEHHGHRHRHEALDHEHAHRHDDGHHTHSHVPPVVGEHTHAHRHEALEHEHEHGPDTHHQHEHAEDDGHEHVGAQGEDR